VVLAALCVALDLIPVIVPESLRPSRGLGVRSGLGRRRQCGISGNCRRGIALVSLGNGPCARVAETPVCFSQPPGDTTHALNAGKLGRKESLKSHSLQTYAIPWNTPPRGDPGPAPRHSRQAWDALSAEDANKPGAHLGRL